MTACFTASQRYRSISHSISIDVLNFAQKWPLDCNVMTDGMFYNRSMVSVDAIDFFCGNGRSKRTLGKCDGE